MNPYNHPPIPEGRVIREVGTAVETSDLVPAGDKWIPACAIGHRVGPGEVYIRRTRAAKRGGYGRIVAPTLANSRDFDAVETPGIYRRPR
jgi:hypothetical protein